MAGPIGLLRQAATLGLQLLLSRLTQGSLELAIARQQAAQWLLLALLAAVMLFLALGCATALLVVAMWQIAGALSLAVLAVAYASVGALLAAALMRNVRSAPPLLAGTLDELRADAALLSAALADPREGPGRMEETRRPVDGRDPVGR